MPGHETFQQRAIQPVQVADGVSYREQRLQVHVQRGVAESGNIHQRNVSVSRLQSKRQIHCDSCRATAALCVHNGENLAT